MFTSILNTVHPEHYLLLVICEMSQHNIAFPRPVPNFLNQIADCKFIMNIYFLKTKHFLTSYMLYFYCFQLKVGFKWHVNHCIVIVTFFTAHLLFSPQLCLSIFTFQTASGAKKRLQEGKNPPSHQSSRETLVIQCST